VTVDANDLIYAYDASRDYDPAPRLEKIKARVLAINSADDERNPPELGIMDREIKRVPNGRFYLGRHRPRRAATAPPATPSSGSTCCPSSSTARSRRVSGRYRFVGATASSWPRSRN